MAVNFAGEIVGKAATHDLQALIFSRLFIGTLILTICHCHTIVT